MERFRAYEPDQQVFMTLDPSENFGRDSFEWFLVTTIKDFDLSAFWAKTDRGGETPYDPRAMLGIILYGFCQGIFSSRKLEHSCRHDLGFMYVSGHNCPDHAAICRFLKNYDQELKLVFRQLVYVAHSKGFIDYHCLALDGTKIRANASHAYTGTLKDFKKRIGAIDTYVGKALERLATSSGEDNERQQRKIDKARAEQDRIKSFLAEATEQIGVSGNEKKQNITDPDSRVMVMPDGTCREAYNAQACVDEKTGLIVGQTVVQAENDMKQLNPVLDVVIGPKDGELQNVQVLADAGYWDPQQLALAENRKFVTYVPDPAHSNPHRRETAVEPKVALVSVERQGDAVLATCSGGKSIPATPAIGRHKNKNHGDAFRNFPTKQDGVCLECSLRSRCFPPGRKEKVFTMSTKKTDNFGIIRTVAQRMESEAGLKIFSRRMPLIERTFAEIKSTLGFRRFLRRGLAAASLEWMVLCLSFNLRRMYSMAQQG